MKVAPFQRSIYLPQPGSLEAAMSKMTMIYWKGKKFWVGKLKEHPEIMTQGRTLKELETNLRDAYRMMILEDVPQDHREKAIAV
jgi:predicted RNase H-like HicB family nuclease